MLALAVSLSLSLLAPPSAAPRLLVLGGNGFVGREVCREAVARGWRVTSLSRRGVNPEPRASPLEKVEWVAGDATDAQLLRSLAADADAFVHAVGLLFDSQSGLGALNFVTSGSRSTPADGSTYDAVMRQSAQALAAAVDASAASRSRPLAFVSAHEAGWTELPSGRALDEAAPEWLRRYLRAKREGEELLLSAPSTRAVIIRPSLMWNWGKLDVLPLLPFLNAAHAAGLGGGAVGKMLPVHLVAASIVQAIEDEAVAGVVDTRQIEALAPLAALKRVGPVDTLTSGLASISRLPYGTSVSAVVAASAAPSAAPRADQLRLYEFEACPFCRRVREAISYLDLCVTVYPCGRGSRHRPHVEAAAAKLGKPRPTFPYLEDTAAGVSLFESDEIVKHLLDAYGDGAPLPPPSDYFLPSALLTGWVANLLRPSRGAAVSARALEQGPAEPLVLYSYDGNQFCRLVREMLVELDVPYTLMSVAKGSPRRAKLKELAGRSTAPYLVDPNTGVAMFESADIVDYLCRTYGK